MLAIIFSLCTLLRVIYKLCVIVNVSDMRVDGECSINIFMYLDVAVLASECI